MTIETCKKQLALAEKKGDEVLTKFWTERLERKMAKAKVERKLKHPKYANIPAEPKKEVKEDAKKPKR